MFTWINKQGVESEDGFVVQRTGRFSVECRDDVKAIELNVESGLANGKPAILYSSSDFTQWSKIPHECEMAENVFRQAMEFQGLVPIDE